VLNEKIITTNKEISAETICGAVGACSTLLSGLYIMIYTIPNWTALVSEKIQRTRDLAAVEKSPFVVASNGAIIFCFVALTMSSFVHSFTYFRLLEGVGAISTGVLQSLRAVLVFLMSAIWFCDFDSTQCFNIAKGLSTLAVAAGVLLYSREADH
jgi:hypothetical protein